MRYETESGRVFVLAYHEPIEWAQHVRAELLALGCSLVYANAAARAIATARPT